MMPRSVSRGRGTRLAVGLAVVGLMLAGCVNLPSGGKLQNVKSLSNSDASQLVITPRAPGAQWDPQEIVQGFLVASGASPNDLSIAREYLDKKYARIWHPNKATPAVIDTAPKLGVTPPPHGVTGGQSSAQVTITSDHLQTLVPAGPNEAGRLQVSPGPAPYVFTFELIQADGGQWRIDSIIEPGSNKTSDSILLLNDSDFERDFLPRNLYYLESGSPQTLVPYPVYIPAKTGQVGGVQQLVEALRTLPPTRSNWLYHAIATAFPPGTGLSAQVQGSKAVVELGGTAARADPATLDQMEAQLVWTLTYAPDSPTGISSVELQVGNRSFPTLLLAEFKSWIPQGPPGPLYFQTLDRKGRPRLRAFTPSSSFDSPDAGQNGVTGNLAPGTRSSQPLSAGLGRGPFTTIAVTPAPLHGLAYFAGCRGKKAYVAPLINDAVLQSATLFGNCTSLSWDNQGDLWAIAGNDVYVLNLPLRQHQVIPVSIPPLSPSDNFVALKVAPDGLRVAMIVVGKNGASVYISAITKKKHSSTIYLAQGGKLLTVGPDLVDPIALTWWDSDHLLVLERQHRVRELYDVPLNGGESAKVLTPAGAVSVTANGQFVAVGTGSVGHGRRLVLVSHGLDGPWVPADPGATPAYVG